MPPRRIMMISDHASPIQKPGGVDCGGQNVYVDHLSRELSELGYGVDIFTRRDDASLPEVVSWQPGVRIFNIAAGPAERVRKEDLLPHIEQFSARCLEHARKEQYQLVHANFWMSGLVAMELKHRLGIPFVITFHALGRVRRLHQNKADQFPDERFAIEEEIMREAECVIAECPQDRDDMLTLYGAEKKKITVVPCGVDPMLFSPVPKQLARAEIGLPDEEWQILQLGRMVPRKGIDNVIRALAALTHSYRRRARLVVVGGEFEDAAVADHPELSRLSGIAEQLGVTDRVKFVGRKGRDELKYYYSASDVFVTTPWYEPFGITPLEAMACATPVIGSNVGGLKHTVEHGGTGYLVPANRPDLLALQLDYLHQRPEKVAQLGYEGLRRVLNYFTWKQVADMVSAVYEAALQERRSSTTRAKVIPVTRASDQKRKSRRAQADRVQRVNGSRSPFSAPLQRAVFIERDDLLAENFGLLDASNSGAPAENAILGLRMLQACGFEIIVISNQPAIAHGSIEEQAFAYTISRTKALLRPAGVELAGFYYCPHHPNASLSAYAVTCQCRKPAPGLLYRAAREHRIDLESSWMIGRVLDDVEAGKRAKCRSILLTGQREQSWEFLRPLRKPDYFARNIDQAAHIISDLENDYLSEGFAVAHAGY